ncbi:MAG TPA: ABC transporter permease, partial [Gemmataceae bacterium]|nr:ABC transporter permease [Gemmataceae bacterium]
MLSLHRTLTFGYLAQRPTRMVLIVVSIALGVATLVATRCLDDSLHQAARGAINPFATLADLLISNGQTGVPADLAERLQKKNLPGLADVQPLVMGRAALVELDDQSIRLIGVNWTPQNMAEDAKGAPEANAWGLKITPHSDDAATNASRYWWDCFLGGKHPVLVGAELAERLKQLPTGADYFQLRRGPEDIQKMANFGTVRLEGPAHILEDEAVFTDVYTAASIIYPQRSGYCTQINLKLAPGADAETVRKKVEQFLKDENEPGRVQTVEANEEMATDVTAGLELGFSVGGYLALMVGMFLVYNTLSVTVAERRRDVGILRSVGATRFQVAGLFVGEAALLGLTGSLLGLPFGYGLAWLALKPMQQVLSEVFVKLPEATVSVSWPVMALALGAGLATTLLAALMPALQAADEQPADAVRRTPQGNRRFYTALQDGAVLVLIAAAVGAVLLRSHLPSLYGSIAFPVCIMGAALLGMKRLSGFLGWALLPFFRPLLGLQGRLAADNLMRSPGRTGLVIGALAATGALVLQTAGFTQSTESALNDWLDNNIAADLYVTAGSGISKAGFSLPMDASIGDELTPGPGRTPPVEGVEAVLPVRFHYFTFRDQFVYLIAVDSHALQGPARDRALGGALHMFDQDKRPADPHHPVCVVSENFAALYHVAVGDHIQIPGRTAPMIDLEVIGSVVDYSYNRGT